MPQIDILPFSLKVPAGSFLRITAIGQIVMVTNEPGQPDRTVSLAPGARLNVGKYLEDRNYTFTRPVGGGGIIYEVDTVEDRTLRPNPNYGDFLRSLGWNS